MKDLGIAKISKSLADLTNSEKKSPVNDFGYNFSLSLFFENIVSNFFVDNLLLPILYGEATTTFKTQIKDYFHGGTKTVFQDTKPSSVIL